MRSPTKPKETLSKVLPLRWSFGGKGRIKHSVHTHPAELVEYLESGRRPRCTKDPIITLVATPPQRNPRGRTFEAPQDRSSPSGSSHSCMDRLSPNACYSPKIPEGQTRPGVDRSVRGGVANGNKVSVDSSVRKRQDQGLEPQLLRGAVTGGHISHSAPQSRDSTLRRSKVQIGASSRTQRDLSHLQEDRKGHKGQEGRSTDSRLSFLKPAFMRKDARWSPMTEPRRHANGQVGKLVSGHLSKLSLSNGTLSTAAHDERGADAIQNCNVHSCKRQQVNGAADCHEPGDMKHAHSSCNIQTKLDLTFRRCASLQRNGDMATPPARRLLLSNKPGYATLQRTQYSTTSLGECTSAFHVCVSLPS